MNYRRTAELLNMTQPAVTQHIHFLEEQYGCKLFHYDRRTLTMTREAELLQRYAENVLYQEKKLKTELTQNKGVSLSIGATKTIGEYVIGDHVSAFLSEPDHRISVTVENTETLLTDLSAGKIDFALIEGYFDRSRYASRLYRKEPFVGLCGKIPSLCRTHNNSLMSYGSRICCSVRQAAAQETFSDSFLLKAITLFQSLKELQLSAISGLSQGFWRITTALPLRTMLWEKLTAHFLNFMSWAGIFPREFNYVYLDTPFSEYAVDVFSGYYK